MKRIFIIALVIVTAIAVSGCAALKVRNENIKRNIINSSLTSIEIQRSPQQVYSDLSRGLEVIVQPIQPVEEVTGWIYHLSGKGFFNAPTVQYVRNMGLSEMSSTDYKLYLKINRADADLSALAYNGTSSVTSVDLSIILKDASGNELFSQNNIAASVSQNSNARKGLGEAYTQALEQIKWNRIVSFLKEDKPAKDNVVKGNGNTDLEQTIIRWDIQSRPQGADIFWRVVSKTPEVKSTNNKYLQTTPYEATKAVDIKGLTPENTNNVRIVLRCEKDGYLPQEKEYNVRMIIDQEEISAFFKLVKEDE